ncbi:MAG: hypothetical protein ABI432_02800 [Flavobacteriales bacterium]
MLQLPNTITDRFEVRGAQNWNTDEQFELKPAAARLLTRLAWEEDQLFRRHGVRLRVDRVSPDGASARCSCTRVKRRLFAPLLTEQDVDALAHHALKELDPFGINPLVYVMPNAVTNAYKEMDADDPFFLVEAVLNAQREDLLYRGVTIPRSALLEPGRMVH